MSYKFLVTFFNGQMDCIPIVLKFFEPDLYKKKFNLNIRQIKYNNVIHELTSYFLLKNYVRFI